MGYCSTGPGTELTYGLLSPRLGTVEALQAYLRDVVPAMFPILPYDEAVRMCTAMNGPPRSLGQS